MATFAIKTPRRIDPSLVEHGDDISVEHKPERGLTSSVRGIVDKIAVIGSGRHFLTSEGATILVWFPGKANTAKITLYGRAEAVQDVLFDNMDELRNRIAS